MKGDLRMLIDKLHQEAIGYLQALSGNPEMLKVKRDDIDAVLHNIFYLLKIVRAKYQVKWGFFASFGCFC